MFKFRCFKASFDFITGKKSGLNYDVSPVSINGAYRSNVYNDGELTHNPRNFLPSMVQLPKSQSNPLKSSKSTGDLAKDTNHSQNITKSSHDVSLNVPNVEIKIQLKDNEKIEKQHILDQQKQEKIIYQQRLAAQEIKREKQETLAAEKRQRQANITRQDKQNTKQEKPIAENKTRSKKKVAPIPPETAVNLQIANGSKNREVITAKQTNKEIEANQIKTTANNPRNNMVYSTNTLENSISNSSGPPPYGEYPEIISDADTNITFGNPVSDSSWDLISQHREQMSRTTAPIAPNRRKEFQYKVGNLRLEGNSDA